MQIWSQLYYSPKISSSYFRFLSNQFGIQETPSKFSPTGDNETDDGLDQGSLAIRGVDLCLPNSSPSCLIERQLGLELGRHKSTPRIANEPWSEPRSESLSVSLSPVGEILEGVA